MRKSLPSAAPLYLASCHINWSDVPKSLLVPHWEVDFLGFSDVVSFDLQKLEIFPPFELHRWWFYLLIPEQFS